MLRGAALLFLVSVLRSTVGQTTLTQHINRTEEHKNVTLACPYPGGTDMPPHTLIIDLSKENPLQKMYGYDSRTKAEPYIHEHYRDRLLIDPQLIKNGSIHLVLTDLRLNDTGAYRCVVVANDKKNNTVFNLNVTASRNLTVTTSSQPASRGRIGLYVGLCVFTVCIITLLVRVMVVWLVFRILMVLLGLFPLNLAGIRPGNVLF